MNRILPKCVLAIVFLAFNILHNHGGQNNNSHVTTKRSLNKFIKIKFSVACMFWLWCYLFQHELPVKILISFFIMSFFFSLCFLWFILFSRYCCERIFSICFHGPWRVGGEQRKGRHKENFMCSSNTWSNSSRVYSRRNSCPINITIKLATTKLEMALMPTFIATVWFREIVHTSFYLPCKICWLNFSMRAIIFFY